MSIKIIFIHHRNCITGTRVKLLEVFEEFDMLYAFWLIFSFHYHCQFVKGQLKQKSGGRGLQSPQLLSPPPPMVSMGLSLDEQLMLLLRKIFVNADFNDKMFIHNKTISNILSNFIPHESLTDDQKDHPWSKKRKNLIQEKNNVYKSYRTSQNI